PIVVALALFDANPDIVVVRRRWSRRRKAVGTQPGILAEPIGDSPGNSLIKRLGASIVHRILHLDSPLHCYQARFRQISRDLNPSHENCRATYAHLPSLLWRTENVKTHQRLFRRAA